MNRLTYIAEQYLKGNFTQQEVTEIVGTNNLVAFNNQLRVLQGKKPLQEATDNGMEDWIRQEYIASLKKDGVSDGMINAYLRNGLAVKPGSPFFEKKASEWRAMQNANHPAIKRPDYSHREDSNPSNPVGEPYSDVDGMHEEPDGDELSPSMSTGPSQPFAPPPPFIAPTVPQRPSRVGPVNVMGNEEFFNRYPNFGRQ